MGFFNFMGNQEHRVFNYKPVYYDQEKDELRQKFGNVDGTNDEKKGTYSPGSYIHGAFRNGNYSKRRGGSTKVGFIIGIVGLILAVVILIYISKFYAMLLS